MSISKIYPKTTFKLSIQVQNIRQYSVKQKRNVIWAYRTIAGVCRQNWTFIGCSQVYILWSICFPVVAFLQLYYCFLQLYYDMTVLNNNCWATIRYGTLCHELTHKLLAFNAQPQSTRGGGRDGVGRRKFFHIKGVDSNFYNFKIINKYIKNQ